MDERTLDPDAMRQFAAWFADAVAAGIAQPEAMALATADRSGAPSVRIVLLRGHGPAGFVFFTNLESRKACELAGNPRAALALYWQALGRQVRVEGTVEAVDRSESAAYFAGRPRGSRIAAWASAQSRPIHSREALDGLYHAAAERFAGGEVSLPPFWGGYRVVPEALELWQHRENRLHDRIRYERAGTGWRMRRLAP